MVSTRNTSRSHAPRMRDQPGDADSRPLGPVEATQANTNEVEALHLVNQRLIEELEQLTRQMQHLRETRQTKGDHSIPPHQGRYDHSPPPPPPPPPRGAEAEAESSQARGHGPQLAHVEEDVSRTKSHITPHLGRKNRRGSIDLGAFNRSSAA